LEWDASLIVYPMAGTKYNSIACITRCQSPEDALGVLFRELSYLCKEPRQTNLGEVLTRCKDADVLTLHDGGRRYKLCHGIDQTKWE
jgi:hypothetical protein